MMIVARDPGSTLHIEWNMETAKTLFLFDWELQPTLIISNASSHQRFQWLVADASAAGDTQFRRDDHCHVLGEDRIANTDCYHCHGHLCEGSPTEHTDGVLYITISNRIASDRAYAGMIRFVLTPASNFITSASITALQSVWTACCYPNYYRRNPSDDVALGFDPEVWEHVHGSNTDEIPYCYWNPMGAQEHQHITGSPGPVRNWTEVNTTSCEDLNHVRCDPDGSITELSLSGLGLKCDQLPDLPALSRIRNFQAMRNQISGTVPSSITESTVLEEFKMSHNFLTGTVPCFASPLLNDLKMDFNMLSGHIPECLLGKPSLEELSLSNNFLGGELPARWGVNGAVSNLVSLEIRNANLHGVLPTDMRVLPWIANIDLSQNHLSGPIPDSMLREATSLYRLSLSHNDLSGTLPQVGPDMRELNILNLDNNHIYGAISDQFDFMRTYQNDELGSSISLQSNSFSGQLPRAVANLTLGEPYIHSFDISNNHFYW